MTKRLSILVVDDEYDLAELLAELLTERGHRVTVAINGLSAISILTTSRFDLVVSDFMMPILDGLEMVKRMRQDDRLARIPVIMMSAQTEAVSAASAGLIHGVLQKPFLPQRLFSEIDRVIKHVPDAQ